jgi:TP901 family phage tail tape measure protein
MATNKFFTIEFKGGLDLINQLSQVELELKRVNDAIKEAKKTGDTEVYKKLRIEQEELKKSSQELKKNLRDSIKDFEGQKAPVGSLVALRQEYTKLTREIQLYSKEQRESAEGLSKIKLAGNLKKEILEIDQSIGSFTSNIGNYKSALLDVGDIVTGGLLTGGVVAAVGATVAAVGQVFELNSQLSDLKADIAKTSGLAAKDVDDLANSLEGLDTRTALEDLLKIAAIGGQLGISSAQGLQKFTESVDVLNTALGESFGGNVEAVTENVGKLSNVLFGVTTDGEEVANRMLAIGNALNVLAASGQASEGTIVDFANRIGGILTPLNATQGQILGLSAAMDELALNPERGATAMVTIINKLGSDLPKFAKALQLSEGELQDAFNADPIKAFQVVAKQAFDQTGGSSTELLKLLNELGVSGVGATEVFLKLANNSDLVSQRIDTATESLGNYNSLADEAAKKNESLAGVWERLKNKISELAASPAAEAFFKGLIQVASIASDVLYNAIGGITQIGLAIKDVLSGDFNFTSVKKLIADEKKKIAEQDKKKNESKDLVLNVDKSTIKSKDINDKNTNELIENDNKNNEKRIKAAKEAAEKRAKEIEDQEKRIGEIRKAISELSAKEINNVYDKQIAELQNKQATQLQKLEDQRKKLSEKVKGQGGTQTKADITESGLIDQETAVILQSIEKQKQEIEKKRQESFEDSKQQLLKLQGENLKAIYDNALKLSQSNLESITTGFKAESVKVDIEFETNINSLKQQYNNGLISQSEFNAQSEKLQAESNQRKLDLEAEHAQRIYNQQINNQKLLEKAIESERKTNERNIEQSNLDAKEKANQDFIDGKIQSEKELNETLKALDDQLKLDLESNNLSATDKQKAAYQDLIDAKVNADKAEIASDTEKTNQKLENLEKEKAKRLEIVNTAINYAGQIADTIFEIEGQKDEQRKEDEITKLDEQYKKKLELAQGNATVETALKQEFENKKLAIEKAAFEKNKQRQIKAALANAALAAVQALANTTLPFPLSLTALIPIAISTGLQIAKIKAQEFADGGQIKSLGNGKIKAKPNTKPTAKGDNVLAYVKAGEVILNERQQELAGGPEFFRSLGVPGFAGGGKVPAPNITGYGSSRYNQTITISDEQIKILAEQIRLGAAEGTKQGASSGTREGAYLGAADNLKLKERQEALIQNTEF